MNETTHQMPHPSRQEADLQAALDALGPRFRESVEQAHRKVGPGGGPRVVVVERRRHRLA